MIFSIVGLDSIGRRHFRNLVALGEKDIVLLRRDKSNRWNQGRDMSPLVLRAAVDHIMERDAASMEI